MIIQWAQTKLVHMTLGYTSVLCTSLVCAHCICMWKVNIVCIGLVISLKVAKVMELVYNSITPKYGIIKCI